LGMEWGVASVVLNHVKDLNTGNPKEDRRVKKEFLLISA